MTERQFELLRRLSDTEWTKPMWLGGRTSSHHSQTLRQLVKLGLAEARRRRKPWGAVKANMYRRTPAGRTAAEGARPIDRIMHRWPGSLA